MSTDFFCKPKKSLKLSVARSISTQKVGIAYYQIWELITNYTNQLQFCVKSFETTFVQWHSTFGTLLLYFHSALTTPFLATVNVSNEVILTVKSDVIWNFVTRHRTAMQRMTDVTFDTMLHDVCHGNLTPKLHQPQLSMAVSFRYPV